MKPDEQLRILIERVDFDMIAGLIRNNRGQVRLDDETLSNAIHDVEALQILSKQYLDTESLNDIIGESSEGCTFVSVTTLEEMFEMAHDIPRVEVGYDESQLVMANETISKQQDLAYDIAIKLDSIIP